MAKKKGKRRRQSVVSKVINLGLILLGLSRPITLLFTGGGDFAFKVNRIITEATFGLARPGGVGGGVSKFDLNLGLQMYAPAGAAIALGKLKGFLMRHFPVRR